MVIDERPKKKKAGCLIWSIPVGVVVAVVALVMPEPPASSRPVMPGDECVVTPDRGTWFAVSDDAWTDLRAALDAGSGPLLGRLLQRDAIFREPKGVRVLVVRTAFSSAWCRVQKGGANEGHEGWVPIADIAKP